MLVESGQTGKFCADVYLFNYLFCFDKTQSVLVKYQKSVHEIISNPTQAFSQCGARSETYLMLFKATTV